MTDTRIVGDESLLVASDVPHAVRWLQRFELAVPLRPYNELAVCHGTEAERDLTKALVLDLRVPMYDSRAVIVRRCEASDQLLQAWEEEKGACTCEGFCGLPFLRALWRVKPMILALPCRWINEGEAA